MREEDRRRIREAVRVAKRLNPAMSPSFFDFIASVLLLENPPACPTKASPNAQQFV